MKHIKITAITLAMFTAMNIPLIALANDGKVYNGISKLLVSNFNSENSLLGWNKTALRGFLSSVSDSDDSENKVITLNVSSDGGNISMAKNFRRIKLPMVCSFKYKPESEKGSMTVKLYNEYSYSTSILTINGSKIMSGKTELYKLNSDTMSNIAIAMTSYNTFNFYIDDTLIKKDVRISVNSKHKLESATAIAFNYNASAESQALIDDIYCYAGAQVKDTYTLLTDSEKAAWRTKNAAAYVAGYTKSYGDGVLREISNPLNMAAVKNGIFYIPFSYTLNQLKIESSANKEGINAVYNNNTYRISYMDLGLMVNDKHFGLKNPLYMADNEIMISADDFASAFALALYYDKEDLYIISKNPSVFETTDDVDNLVYNMKYKMTSVYYAKNELGEKAKITDNLDNLNLKPVSVIKATADYEPQAENPAASSIDGNIATRYSADGTNHYLQLDFGAIKSICGYAVAWASGNTRKNVYHLEYSDDGITYIRLPMTYSTGLTSGYEYYTLPITARYVRYYGNGTISNDTGMAGVWNSISEIKFFEIEG